MKIMAFLEDIERKEIDEGFDSPYIRDRWVGGQSMVAPRQ
jgi:hypothetical protein